MSIFNSITKADFLNDYWQKKPYIFNQVMSDVVDIVDGDELAGLACEASVEARIICGYQQENSRKPNEKWTCQQGPFDEEIFSTLPEKNWTLLVQGVDQWIEEARDVFAFFDFLPQWRLEDVMASYAPVGGSVGPHFDYYDVFLIQVSGSRQWQLGQCCDGKTALQNDSPVKLLEQFTCDQSSELHPGDMIYIPAGKAHWGIATSDDCITFSVGFRAPSEKELLASMLDTLTEQLMNKFSDDKRYKDNATSIDEHPAKINAGVQQQLAQTLQALKAMDFQKAINQSFGQLVTEPRYSLPDEHEPIEECITEVELNSLFDQYGEIVLLHPVCSRFAFSEEHLFVNGDAYDVCENFSKAICNGLIINPMMKSEMAVLIELINREDIVLEIHE